MENSVLKGIVTATATARPANALWTPSSACRRTDTHFIESDRNYNNAQQECHHVNHMTRSWVLANNPSAELVQAYETMRNIPGLRRPVTTVYSFHRIVLSGRFLNIEYHFNPESWGLPPSRVVAWASNDWHKDRLADQPNRKAFSDALVEWSKATQGLLLRAANASSASPAPELAYAAPARVSTPVARQVAPGSGEFRSPALGTRFHVADGHFEIARVDGMTISTLNASSQGATWQPGGLLPLGSATRFDRAVAESIFPLSIGKKVEFVQQAGSGSDAWRQTLEVVRQETLTLDGRAYPTFVIEDRTEAVGPGMAEFVRKRTLWYSPDAGWLLRLREEQTAGPPQRMNNWDVLRVIPPS